VIYGAGSTGSGWDPSGRPGAPRQEIAAYSEGLDLAEPGPVLMPEWRTQANPAHVINCYAGVGRKP
jgi:hypothetical protein